jgi:hypothetical protein
MLMFIDDILRSVLIETFLFYNHFFLMTFKYDLIVVLQNQRFHDVFKSSPAYFVQVLFHLLGHLALKTLLLYDRIVMDDFFLS